MLIIEESVNWNTENEFEFGPISDWHLPGLIDLCQKYSKIKDIEKCYQFQKINVQKTLVRKFCIPK